MYCSHRLLLSGPVSIAPFLLPSLPPFLLPFLFPSLLPLIPLSSIPPSLPPSCPPSPPAHSQSELRGRSNSDILSYDQLDDELKRWEEELGQGGVEGEEGAEGLLDSKTDDDLMLEFAEFL